MASLRVWGCSGMVCSIPELFCCTGRVRRQQCAAGASAARLRLLNDETGDTLNANQFWRAMVRDYYLGKGGYAYISRSGTSVVSLHYVEESRVTVLKNTDPIFKDFDFLVDGVRYRPYDFLKILRNSTDGAQGVPLTEESSRLIETAYASLVFERNMVRRGGNKKGFLKSEKNLDEQSLAALKSAFAKLYSADSEGSDSFVLLNNGIDFRESSNTSVELQLNENKVTNAAEFAKLFHVSADCIQGKASEQDVASIARLAAIPLMTAIQCALNKDLLLEAEKGSLYFAFDTKELLRGDMQSRFNAYKTALDANFMQIDEVRYAEDMEPLGLNWIRLGLQDVLYNPKTGALFTPNTGTWQCMGRAPDTGGSGEPLQEDAETAILEERGRYYKRDEKGRFAGGGGGGGKAGKRKKKPLPKDSEGVSYRRPQLKLSKKEYSKVMHEISTNYYNKYDGKTSGILHMARKNDYCKYFFEIHGYDEYNIYKKEIF